MYTNILKTTGCSTTKVHIVAAYNSRMENDINVQLLLNFFNLLTQLPNDTAILAIGKGHEEAAHKLQTLVNQIKKITGPKDCVIN